MLELTEYNRRIRRVTSPVPCFYKFRYVQVLEFTEFIRSILLAFIFIKGLSSSFVPHIPHVNPILAMFVIARCARMHHDQSAPCASQLLSTRLLLYAPCCRSFDCRSTLLTLAQSCGFHSLDNSLSSPSHLAIL